MAGWAQAAVDAAAALDAGVIALRQERDSRLRIAASMTVAEYLLPVWLTALAAADPGAAVALSAVNSDQVATGRAGRHRRHRLRRGPRRPAGLHASRSAGTRWPWWSPRPTAGRGAAAGPAASGRRRR